MNRQLLAACLASRSRTIIGRNTTIAEACLLEQPHLLPMAEDARDHLSAHRGQQGLRTSKVQLVFNSALAGTASDGARLSTIISIERDGTCVAEHPRDYGRRD